MKFALTSIPLYGYHAANKIFSERVVGAGIIEGVNLNFKALFSNRWLKIEAGK